MDPTACVGRTTDRPEELSSPTACTDRPRSPSSVEDRPELACASPVGGTSDEISIGLHTVAADHRVQVAGPMPASEQARHNLPSTSTTSGPSSPTRSSKVETANVSPVGTQSQPSSPPHDETTYTNKLDIQTSSSSPPSSSSVELRDVTRSSAGSTNVPSSSTSSHAPETDRALRTRLAEALAFNATLTLELEQTRLREATTSSELAALRQLVASLQEQLMPSSSTLSALPKDAIGDHQPAEPDLVGQEPMEPEGSREGISSANDVGVIPQLASVKQTSLIVAESITHSGPGLFGGVCPSATIAVEEDPSQVPCAQSVQHTPSFPVDHELRQLQRLAREDAREVPIQNAGRVVSDVQHVHAPDFLDDVLILVLPYLALHELAVLGRVDYKRLLSVSEEMRRRPLWLHLSDHGRLVWLLCSRTRAEQTSRVGPLLRLRSFPSVTLVVDLRDKRALPKWSLDRLRDSSEDGSGDELESAKLVVSGQVDVIVNAARATRPKLSFKHMRFILNNFRPAVTRFSLGSSSCPCFLWTTIEMEIDVPVRNHIACVGVAPVLRVRPGRDGPANPSKHRLFLVLDSLEDDRRIGLGVGNWLQSHVFGQTWSEIEEWEPSHWPPWEVPSFLRTHVWVSSRAAGALHRAGVKPWLGPTVTIETRADWTATDEDGLADQVTAKVVSKTDNGRRVTESYRTQQPSQICCCGNAQAAADAHALASLRLFATALPYADRDLKDDACEAAYLTLSLSKSNWWGTYLGSGDRPKQPLLSRARALVAEQDRAETLTAARSPAREVDLKSVKPVFAQRIPHLIVEALFEVLDLGELAVCSRVCFAWLVLAAKEISLEHVSFDAEDTVHLNQLFCSRTKAQSKGKVADLLRLRRFASVTVIVNIGAKHDHLRHHVFRDRLQDEHQHKSDDDYDLVRTG